MGLNREIWGSESEQVLGRAIGSESELDVESEVGPGLELRWGLDLKPDVEFELDMDLLEIGVVVEALTTVTTESAELLLLESDHL